MLLTTYQITELIIGLFLFFPLFYLYYRLQNEEPVVLNIIISGIFFIFILLIKNIIVNYAILTKQASEV